MLVVIKIKAAARKAKTTTPSRASPVSSPTSLPHLWWTRSFCEGSSRLADSDVPDGLSVAGADDLFAKLPLDFDLGVCGGDRFGFAVEIEGAIGGDVDQHLHGYRDHGYGGGMDQEVEELDASQNADLPLPIMDMEIDQ